MSSLKSGKNDDFELFKSIHDFYINKSKEINNDYNKHILIKFLKDPKIIINNTNNLELFLEELSNQIQKGNNLILPFINPCYDLIEIYINNNDNIYKQIFSDNQIFILLIQNSFFNRKNLIPIYAYFTRLYSEVNSLETEEKLEKFVKCFNLWKLFYSYKNTNANTDKKSFSSFCFMGTGLELVGINEILDYINIGIKINFINNYFMKYINDDDDLINIEDKHIKYSILSVYKNNVINSINFVLNVVDKNINLEINVENKNIYSIYLEKVNITKNNISILNNFYGGIRSIEIYFTEELNNKTQKNIFSRIIYPFPLKNNEGKIFQSSFQFNSKNNNNLKNNYNKINISLEIKDINLVKVNYINYLEKKFNIIDYFGGVSQFLPFLYLINGLYRNKKIKKINNIEKENFLIDFAKSILLIIYNYINNSGIKKQQNFEKYWIFYLYLLNKIEPFENMKEKLDINEFQSFNSEIYKNNQCFFEMFKIFINYINTKDKKQLEKLQDLISKKYFERNAKLENISLFGKTNNQLYKNKMKQLFIYNRLWSNQYLYFRNVGACYQNNKDNNSKIKYKRINYYTCNFQQPLIYPILDIKNYTPIFNKFNFDNLFKNSKDKIIDYNFSLDNFKNTLPEKLIINYLDNNDICQNIKCCLIKKLYHIKGIIKALELSDSDFQIFFSSNTKENGIKCNKNDINKNEYNPNLCYGSVFTCLEKDKKMLLLIPRYKIMFVLLRIYYYRPTGLEIFTSDNKSYYFNFWKYLNLNGQDPIIKLFEKNFISITKEDNTVFGWFNPFYLRVLSPLFNEKIFKWNKKKYYYSNFDKLMIINLFSNRSFNDLIQYPIFPMLYNEIGKTRVLDQPIGFQVLSEESRERKNLIIDSYSSSINDEESSEKKNNENYYFSLFYSNISYTCNYLIRVFPYTFIAIEYQGDGFDEPDRLFFSINSTFHNTLNQKSDLRELIPEMFYFPPLFYNKNEIQLNKLSNGNEIDNVIIHNKDENNLRKYIFLKDMRKNLEEANINLWIDLIFGIKKDYNDKKERYYDIKKNISFHPDENILNDSILLQSCDFGVLPYQILKEKFPEKPKISKDLEGEIYKLNKRNFIKEHRKCLNYGKESFICIGEKGISDEYLTIINEIKKENNNKLDKFLNLFSNEEKEIKEYENLYYLFIGDVFGNLSVYLKKDKQSLNNKNINNEEIDCTLVIEQINDKYKLLKSLNDHTDEIKYIDYNPRLNLLIDYSLDGYINLYAMPTLKLIHVIQPKDFDINEDINNVVLISNPFPMICCVTLKKIIVLDINGQLINKLDLMDNKIFFCIDKNCGLFNDYISYWKDRKEIKYNLI